MKALLIGAALMLTGCVHSGALMRHPDMGKTVECGLGVWGSPLLSMTVESRERDCINDYRLQGYERVPE